MTLHARIVDELGRLIVARRHARWSGKRCGYWNPRAWSAARPRVGTWTRPPEHWDAIDPDVIAWRGAGPDGHGYLAELRELRMAIEPQAAGMAAWHRRPDELAVLAAAFELMTEAVDLHAFQEADRAFHVALYRASGNALIARLHVPVVAALEEIPGDGALVAHSRVVTMVLAKNADGAESATRRLMETVAPYRSPAS
ncbi:FadR/GntR family transcriptional regulator [Amycolatopsis sp. lyj-112]|uniref:FadR/GntR family transcriptional regulator n=1 Tax=Amycolatopsis sp. lyj-112 TaxID=2789288 RepID=UPI00397B5BB0